MWYAEIDLRSSSLSVSEFAEFLTFLFKANLFGSYFSANSSLSDSNAPDPPTQPLSNPVPSIIISARKVRRVLRSLKTDKASGPDGVPPDS